MRLTQIDGTSVRRKPYPAGMVRPTDIEETIGITQFAQRRGTAVHRKYKPKGVYQLNDKGEVLEKWDSVTEAAKALGVCDASIHSSIRKGVRCCGFRWAKIEEQNQQ